MEKDYNGDRLNIVEDWDEPFHIPLSILRDNPKLYAELLIKRKEYIDKLYSAFRPALKVGDKKIGRAVVFSTVSGDEPFGNSLWNNSDMMHDDDDGKSKTGLKGFFIPAQRDAET